jgi:CRISPR-associated protein Csd2
MGESILIQSDDYKKDSHGSIKSRYDSVKELKQAEKDRDKQAEIACKTWFDVRAFGAVIAFKGDSEATNAVRGPVSIQSAFSVEPVDVMSLQITKSVNATDKDKKSSDTMGMKHRVSKGVYVTYGSINRQLAEKTGFSDEDAEKLKQAMLKMFENDESSARPAGSMEVKKLIWWTHTDKILSSAKVHRSLNVNADGTYELATLDGLDIQELDGE